MSMYDIVYANCTCPRCGFYGKFEIEAFFPCGSFQLYNLRDKLINITNNKIKESFISEGYVECTSCQKDFFVDIVVENKMIKLINVNSKQGYII